MENLALSSDDLMALGLIICIVAGAVLIYTIISSMFKYKKAATTSTALEAEDHPAVEKTWASQLKILMRTPESFYYDIERQTSSYKTGRTGSTEYVFTCKIKDPHSYIIPWKKFYSWYFGRPQSECFTLKFMHKTDGVRLPAQKTILRSEIISIETRVVFEEPNP